jgi:hypothetical protein
MSRLLVIKLLVIVLAILNVQSVKIVSNAYGPQNKLYSTPYLTLAEYKQAPTAIDYNNLVVASADPAVQDAELSNVIARASSWMDNFCNQVLEATLEEEQQRCRLGSDGTLYLHPSYSPIVAVTSLSYGMNPNQMTNVSDLSQGWVENQSFILPYSSVSTSWSSQGPLAFGIPSRPRGQVFVSYTYIAGYFNDILGASASAGSSSITVAENTGLVSGTKLTIYDGASSENVTVASSYVFGSDTVPLASPLKYAHASGVALSALPPAVKQAAVFVTSAFLKARGDYSLTMMSTSAVGQAGSTNSGIDHDMNTAKELLYSFKRIR